MLYTYATLGDQVAVARVAEPAGCVIRTKREGDKLIKRTKRQPANRSTRWKFSWRHDDINNNRNTGQNDRSNNIVVENAGPRRESAQ